MQGLYHLVFFYTPIVTTLMYLICTLLFVFLLIMYFFYLRVLICVSCVLCTRSHSFSCPFHLQDLFKTQLGCYGYTSLSCLTAVQNSKVDVNPKFSKVFTKELLLVEESELTSEQLLKVEPEALGLRAMFLGNNLIYHLKRNVQFAFCLITCLSIIKITFWITDKLFNFYSH